MKKLIASFAIILVAAVCLAGCSVNTSDNERNPVKVLLLPAFEVEKMAGDFPGEAQYYYEAYLQGGEEYEIKDGTEGTTLYYKDGIALCLLDEGKVHAAINTMAVLKDERFDFSDAYIIVTGCAGSAAGYGIMGDVYVITSAVDYDLGHKADPREMTGDSETTWFHDEAYDSSAYVMLNSELTDAVYDKVKDVPLETTELTSEYLEQAFHGEEWASRQPQVLKGTAVTGDNFWKGEYDHDNAVLMTETYGCPDPYAVTDMEDIAVCETVESCGMLDRLIVLRDSVNMDLFAPGMTPEKLWNTDDELASDDSEESFDIFATAMKNNYEVGKVVIDAILDGEL